MLNTRIMKNIESLPNDLQALRIKAEEIIEQRAVHATHLLSEAEMLKLIHELEVRQVELELQNEQLHRAISEAQNAIELYDLAPVGYFSLSKNGTIQRLNLCGAAMLGLDRLSKSMAANYAL